MSYEEIFERMRLLGMDRQWARYWALLQSAIGVNMLWYFEGGGRRDLEAHYRTPMSEETRRDLLDDLETKYEARRSEQGIHQVPPQD